MIYDAKKENFINYKNRDRKGSPQHDKIFFFACQNQVSFLTGLCAICLMLNRKFVYYGEILFLYFSSSAILSLLFIVEHTSGCEKEREKIILNLESSAH